MRWHVTTYKSDLDSPSRELVVEGNEILFGRGTDCHVQFDDPNMLQVHAKLVVKETGAQVLVSCGTDFWLQGSPVSAVTIHPGVTVQLCSWALMFREHGPEFDGVVEIVHSEEPLLAVEDLDVAIKRERWGLPRLGSISAALFSFVVVLGLYPIVQGHPNHLSETLRFAYAPGSLHTSHRFFETRCEACHLDGFQRVPSKACQECHADAGDHADPEEHDLALLRSRCSTCHPEHVSLDLSTHAEELCITCHLDPAANSEASASDFAHDHPLFRVSTREGKVALASARDDDSLRFSHALHGRAEGVRGPDGVVELACSSCHTTDAKGEILPVSMETHCASCHPLTFLDGDVLSTLRHKDVQAIPQLVSNALAARAYFEADGAPSAGRRRPGEEVHRDSGAGWVSTEAGLTSDLGFGRATCGRCHEVQPTASGWEVPARAPARFSNLRFEHRQHRVSDCGLCHPAQASEEATDVLMPDLEVCRSCHGGEHAELNRIPSACTMCHVFHPHTSGGTP